MIRPIYYLLNTQNPDQRLPQHEIHILGIPNYYHSLISYKFRKLIIVLFYCLAWTLWASGSCKNHTLKILRYVPVFCNIFNYDSRKLWYAFHAVVVVINLFFIFFIWISLIILCSQRVYNLQNVWQKLFTPVHKAMQRCQMQFLIAFSKWQRWFFFNRELK